MTDIQETVQAETLMTPKKKSNVSNEQNDSDKAKFMTPKRRAQRQHGETPPDKKNKLHRRKALNKAKYFSPKKDTQKQKSTIDTSSDTSDEEATFPPNETSENVSLRTDSNSAANLENLAEDNVTHLNVNNDELVSAKTPTTTKERNIPSPMPGPSPNKTTTPNQADTEKSDESDAQENERTPSDGPLTILKVLRRRAKRRPKPKGTDKEITERILARLKSKIKVVSKKKTSHGGSNRIGPMKQATKGESISFF